MRRAVPAVVLLAAALTATACTSTSTPGIRSPSASASRGTLPDLVGMGLQSAQDAAQSAGFQLLRSHDALGRQRHQIFDRDWKVCTQNPKPGTHATDTTVDLGAVKLREDCPATDQGTAAPTVGATMPDFVGKAASTAVQALDSSTSIDLSDASGKGRVIVIQSNWQICTQDPKPGTPVTGQPVTLTAVKFGETCP